MKTKLLNVIHKWTIVAIGLLFVKCQNSKSDPTFQSFSYRILIDNKGDSLGFNPYNYNDLYAALDTLELIKIVSSNALITIPDEEIGEKFIEGHMDKVDNNPEKFLIT